MKRYEVYVNRYPGDVYHCLATSEERAITMVLEMEPTLTKEDLDVSEVAKR